MALINTINGFKPLGRFKRKKQIVLSHTCRNVIDYVSSLKHRYNGENKKLPHFIIDREGKVYNIIPTNTYGDYLDTTYHNKNSIIITLENLGWLRKNPLKNNYVNWIGNEFNGKIYERKWRGYHFWQPYTEEQIINLVKLIDMLCDEYDIPRHSIGHNVKVDKVEKYNGIISRSNCDTDYTDLNPAFDFDIFIEKENHE